MYFPRLIGFCNISIKVSIEGERVSGWCYENTALTDIGSGQGIDNM